MDRTHQKHAKKPRAQLRRNEHQVSNEKWIINLLNQGSHGTLASIYQDQPFISPVLYLYKEMDHAIYFHGARTGRLRANLHFNPKVAFNVLEFGRILSHQDASEFNVAYKSVTIFGSAQLIKDKELKMCVLNQLLEKYAPQLKTGTDFHIIQPDELEITAVYQIEIEDWTGKQQIESSEYLDSFEYTPNLEQDT